MRSITPERTIGRGQRPPSLLAMNDRYVRFAGLSRVAVATNNFADGKTINLMMRINVIVLSGHTGETTRQRCTAMVPSSTIVDFRWQGGTIVVTNPTPEGRTATCRHNRTFAIVMRTRWSRQFRSSGLFVAQGKSTSHVRPWDIVIFLLVIIVFVSTLQRIIELMHVPVSHVHLFVTKIGSFIARRSSTAVVSAVNTAGDGIAASRTPTPID